VNIKETNGLGLESCFMEIKFQIWCVFEMWSGAAGTSKFDEGFMERTDGLDCHDVFREAFESLLEFDVFEVPLMENNGFLDFVLEFGTGASY